MPTFSILIPTRNRACLLKDCLQTAIAQDFDDYEIVVSDNNSQDDTKTVVKGYMGQSDKIRYVNPGRDLSMCDNFEFVFSQAQGEYVIYLSDDDAPTDILLPCLNQLLNRFETDVMVFERGYYQHPDIPEAGRRGTFLYQMGTGQLYEVESAFVIQALCNFQIGPVHSCLPRMLNCAVSRRAVLDCAAYTGRFFLPPFPDYSAACQLIGHLPRYYWIDLPLYICGASLFSNTGLQYNRKKKFEEYVSLFGQDLLEGTPYPMRYLNQSYFLATFQHFQRLYPSAFSYPINFQACLTSMFHELMRFQDYEDIAPELECLRSYMRACTGDEQLFQELRHPYTSRRARLANATQKILRRSKTVYQLARTAKDLITNILGHQSQAQSYASIASIFDASQLLSKALMPSFTSLEQLQPIPLQALDKMPQAL